MKTETFPEIKQVIKAEAWPKDHVAHVISVRVNPPLNTSITILSKEQVYPQKFEGIRMEKICK